MNFYSPISVTCPKCGFRDQPGIRYQKTAHGECKVEFQHLHGWCGRCGYEGVEYVFTVRKSKKEE